jgi:hypothetical protein
MTTVRRELSNLSRTKDTGVARLIFERAKAHEATVDGISDSVRDKAKTIVGTATFVSAVVLGLISVVLPSFARSETTLLLSSIVLSGLLVSQLVRAIYTALEAMTHESFVSQSSADYLALARSPADLSAAYAESISQIVAFANQSHEHVRHRVNQLILAQHAFKWGLIYFGVIAFLGAFIVVPTNSGAETRLQTRLQNLEDAVNRQLAPAQQRLGAEFDRLSLEVTKVASELSETRRLQSDEKSKLEDIQRALEDRR